VRLIAGKGLALATTGIGPGIVGAFALTRLLSSLFFEVSPTDTATFVVVSVMLVCVLLAVCYVPARRATKVDPMMALRCE